jgi:hypothetical protein
VQLPSPIHEFWNHQQRVPGIACYARSLWHCPKHAEDSAGLQVFAGDHGCHRQTKLSIVLSPICFIPIDNNCYILYIYNEKIQLVICVVFLNIFRCASQFCQISPMLMPILACECSFSYHVWKGKTASHFQKCSPRFW